jgi:uncharacterized membrane protein YqjE
MEQNDRFPNSESPSYVALMREMTSSAKNIIQSEIALAKAELKETGPALAKHTSQMVLFATLAVLSVFPLLAFAVIGLGHLLGNEFWLSALIVGVLCAAIGAPLAYRAFKKLKNDDLKFDRTVEGLENGARAIRSTAKNIADSLEGDRYEPNQTLHH